MYALIATVHSECERDMFAAVRGSELTFSQLELLHYLAVAPIAPTVKHAAHVMRMRPSSVSLAVRGLVDRGLVDRVEDERDARVRRLLITPRGREAVEASSACRLDALRNYWRGLEPERRYRLGQLLEEVARDPEIARRLPSA